MTEIVAVPRIGPDTEIEHSHVASLSPSDIPPSFRNLSSGSLLGSSLSSSHLRCFVLKGTRAFRGKQWAEPRWASREKQQVIHTWSVLSHFPVGSANAWFYVNVDCLKEFCNCVWSNFLGISDYLRGGFFNFSVSLFKETFFFFSTFSLTAKTTSYKMRAKINMKDRLCTYLCSNFIYFSAFFYQRNCLNKERLKLQLINSRFMLCCSIPDICIARFPEYRCVP